MKVSEEIVVAVRANDPTACSVLKEIVTGPSSDRYARSFSEVRPNRWEGSVSFKTGGASSVVHLVFVIVSPASPLEAPAAWVLEGERNLGRNFTSRAKTVARYPVRTPGKRRFLIKSGMTGGSFVLSAANQIVADLVRQEARFRPHVLRFGGGVNGPHFQTIDGWVENGDPFSLTSALCLHATQDKGGIVGDLSPSVLRLLTRSVRCAFDTMPSITGWDIWSFGPDDVDLLWERGIEKILLPYMIDAPREQVRRDLARNLVHSRRVAQAIQAGVNFPVRLHQLHEMLPVNIDCLLLAAKERATLALPGLLANPPEIFKLLANPADIQARVEQEFFLYMAETIAHGQVKGENRPKIASVSLEVHGGYIIAGGLDHGPDGEFLPMAWFNKAVTQHYGEWTDLLPQRNRERSQLDAVLSAYGY